MGEATKIERQNLSTRNGKYSDSESEARHNNTRLGQYWEKWCKDADAGRWVDSAKYEGFVRYALKDGKSNTYQVMYYLIRGYKLGILDNLSLVNIGGELVAQSPHMEHIIMLADGYEKGQKFVDFDGNVWPSEVDYMLAIQDGDKAAKFNFSDDYKQWFLQRVNYSKRVRERFTKVARIANKADHDYIQDFFWEWDERQIKDALSQSTGNVDNITPAGIANIYGGFIENAMYWTDADLQDKISKFKTADWKLFESWKKLDENGNPKMIPGTNRPEVKPGEMAYGDEQLDQRDIVFGNIPLRTYRDAILDALRIYDSTHDLDQTRAALQDSYRRIWGKAGFVSPLFK